MLVDIAREKAYFTGTFNDGIVYLFSSGIKNYDICEQILKGKLTLRVETNPDGQKFVACPDSWTPPGPDMSDDRIRQEVYEYCNQMSSCQVTQPAWRRFASEMEEALIDDRVMLLRQLAKVSPREAHSQMVSMRESVIEMSNSRALRHSIVEDAKQKIATHKDRETQKKLRAKYHLDPCGDMTCQYSRTGICSFSGRNTQGCVKESRELQLYLDSLAVLPSSPEYFDLLTKLVNKQFSFVFQGHEYTFEDSARDQSECPHCGQKAVSGMIHPVDDNKSGNFAFIGIKKLAEDQHAVCFECLKCLNKLFYHANDQLVKTFEERT